LAGDRLIRLRSGRQLQGQELGDAADADAHQFLSRTLTVQRAADAVLSEEGTDSAARLQSQRVWIIDPLDGTREYRSNRADWAVHVALWAQGRITAAAISIPAEHSTYSTAITNEWESHPPKRRMITVSRSNPPPWTDKLLEAGYELTHNGSAGYKTCQVIEGRASAYVHGVGLREWDVAAPMAVAHHMGLWCSDLDGNPLLFNQALPLISGLLICHRELAEPMLEVLARRGP